MDKRFPLSRHLIFKLIFLGGPVLGFLALLTLLVQVLRFEDSPIWVIVKSLSIIALVYVLWLVIKAYRQAKYSIRDGNLIYALGWNKGEILIPSIKSIQRSTYPAAGNRPALDWNGLLLRYGEGRTIFLSPADQEAFIQSLCQINGKIKLAHSHNYRPND